MKLFSFDINEDMNLIDLFPAFMQLCITHESVVKYSHTLTFMCFNSCGEQSHLGAT